ncbi:MAG TPA: hypothetical protein VIP11_19585 [Gemmatimonadaceae bacterium]
MAGNPFIIGHHAEGDHFADRETEVARIARTFADPSSRLLVYGDRRLGKSSAIRTAAAVARADGHAVAVVDLAAATSGAAASQRLLTAVHKEIGTRWRDALARITGSLRGAVTLKPALDASGNPTFAISVQPAASPAEDLRFFTDVLDAIEHELTERDLTLGLAIDEFQRLAALTDTAIDWQLKEVFERHRRIAYVCAGSEQSIIEQMLENRKVGLWKASDVLHVGPIPQELLVRWMIERAAATGMQFDVVAAAAVCRLTHPRTRDVVQLARATWDLARERGVASKAVVVEAMELLVREQAPLHQRQWSRLGEAEQRILLVVARDPATALLSAETLERFRLGPKSSVHRAIATLIEHEILVEDGRGVRAFDDPFFRRWVEVFGLEDLSQAPPPLLPDDWAPPAM